MGKIGFNPSLINTTEYIIYEIGHQSLLWLGNKVPEFKISSLSKEVTLILQDSYKCQNLRKTFSNTMAWLTSIRESLESLFPAVLELDFITLTGLSIGVRNPYLPLEIVLQWDPIFNLPYIPSSAIKGLVRSYLEERKLSLCGKPNNEVFGSYDTSSTSKMNEGLIIFLDAYPIECEEYLIVPEIMNPIMPKANSELDVKPTPLIYPVISEKTRFKFLIALREPQCVDEVAKRISEALEFGFGSKTSLGYGVLRSTSRFTKV